MSCGRPHETSCHEVLEAVYLYLDLECEDPQRTLIRTHLDECSPCLREYGIEQEVKHLVHRCCTTEHAPSDLIDRLRARLAGLTGTGAEAAAE